MKNDGVFVAENHKEVDSLMARMVSMMTQHTMSGLCRDAIIELVLKNLPWDRLDWGDKFIRMGGEYCKVYLFICLCIYMFIKMGGEYCKVYIFICLSIYMFIKMGGDKTEVYLFINLSIYMGDDRIEVYLYSSIYYSFIP